MRAPYSPPGKKGQGPSPYSSYNSGRGRDPVVLVIQEGILLLHDALLERGFPNDMDQDSNDMNKKSTSSESWSRKRENAFSSYKDPFDLGSPKGLEIDDNDTSDKSKGGEGFFLHHRAMGSRNNYNVEMSRIS